MSNREASPHEFLSGYNRDSHRDDIAEGEELRAQIHARFPIDSWSDLPLERYALGLPESNEGFCWWMEFGAVKLGSIRGGAAKKHIIYKHRTGEWKYTPRDAYSNEQEAWEAIRGGFVEAFDKARNGEWLEIDKIEPLVWGPALRVKALHVYFPDEVLPVYSRDHLQHFLRLLDRPEGEERTYDVVRLNRALLAALRDIPQLSKWKTTELARFLYAWADPRETKRIVKIAPGRDALFWDDCLDGGYICVGWDDIGDLAQFNSKEEFRERFAEVYGEHYGMHQSQITRKANELWTLFELEAGDVVVANKGTSQILAVGEVVEPGYEWRADRPEYKHIVRVRWDTSYARHIEPQKKWALVTVSKISAAQFARLTAGRPVEIPVDALFKELESALQRKGQVILYGPPGTGKTYAARRFAVWWLLREAGERAEAILTDERAFAEAERWLSTTQVSRRLWWIVANPREWSWDRLFREKEVEYRYGRLHKNYPLVQKGDLVIGYQSTPDKKIVALARIAGPLYSDENGDPRIKLTPVATISDGLTYDELTADEALAKSEPLRFRNQGTLFALTEEEADHLLALLAERNPELTEFIESEDAVGPLTRITFHPSYSYEDFIEGFRPVRTGSETLALRLEDGLFKRVCREAQGNPKRRYIVLIDEVNRANVAKVFGEIITLLERDKRGLNITLPQSRESFNVPENVYVLCTMNTADRSIKLLDAALRRRFAFLELMPDTEILHGGRVGGLALDVFLDELNRRIAEAEGREKQIGHSYLIDDGQPLDDSDEFARRFRQEILPLLQEYCYDDYGTLAKYLGDRLVDEKAQALNEDLFQDTESLIAALEQEFGGESQPE